MRLVFSSVLVIALCAAGAQAQVLEEIVVTAQKVEESAQEVGIAITAYSGDQLKELGFSGSLELEMHTPGLMTSDFSGGAGSVYTLRGVGQIDFGDHQEQTVAVYTDGAYNSFLGGVAFAMYDIERVEILRGPQGTLFGRNATGGVLHVITAKPTREPDGYVEVRAGEYGEYRGELAVGGPLSETVAARFAGVVHQSGGMIKNSLGPDQQDYDNYNGRLQLLWDASEDVEVLLSGYYGRYKNNGLTYTTTRAIIDSEALTGPITGGVNDGQVKVATGQQYADFCSAYWLAGAHYPPDTPDNVNCLFNEISSPNFDNLHRVDVIPNSDQWPGLPDNFLKRKLYGGTGTVTWDVSETLRLVSITDYKALKKDYREDTDGTDLFAVSFYLDGGESSQWSTELRLQGQSEALQWIAGFYYLNIDHDFSGGMDADQIFLSSVRNDTVMDTSTYAFFAQGEYEISPQFSIIAGFRWTEDEKDILVHGGCTDVPGFEGTCDFFYGGMVQNNVTIATGRSEGEWSGTFELNWRPDDDLLLYAKYSRGNKAGGYNTGYFTAFTREAFEFPGEVLTNYEGGFKSTIFEGRARLNGSVFYYDYQDFQSFFQLGNNFSVQPHDAEVLGGELELVASPWEGWEFAVGLSLLDAMQLDVNNNVVTRDRPMPYSPDVSVNALARYQWPMLDGMMSIQVDMAYFGEHTLNAIDHPGLTQDGYTLVNARLAWASDDGRWQADVSALNIGDVEYLNQAYDGTTFFVGTVIGVPNVPGRIYGSVRYNF